MPRLWAAFFLFLQDVILTLMFISPWVYFCCKFLKILHERKHRPSSRCSVGASLEQRNIMIQKRKWPTQATDTTAAVDTFSFSERQLRSCPLLYVYVIPGSVLGAWQLLLWILTSMCDNMISNLWRNKWRLREAIHFVRFSVSTFEYQAICLCCLKNA